MHEKIYITMNYELYRGIPTSKMQRKTSSWLKNQSQGTHSSYSDIE